MRARRRFPTPPTRRTRRSIWTVPAARGVRAWPTFAARRSSYTARSDGVCPVQNAWRVANLLGTRDVRVVILPRSQHIITRDVERAEVARELREFYARIVAQTPVEP